MKTAIESGVIPEVPRWSLWLVAVVCFGPLVAVLLLGVLMLPLWVGMLIAQLTQPERFANELSGSIWHIVYPIGLVLSGLIGITGLVRLLTLSRRERPKSHRVFTIGMVAIGLAALMTFDVPMAMAIFSDVSEGLPIAGSAVYIFLPFAGAAWLLSKSWRFLLAVPIREGSQTNLSGRDS